MAISTTAGTKVFIACTVAGGPIPQAQATEPANLTAYKALLWTEIKEVESVGEFGDQSADVTFLAVGDARTRHLKGSRDAGVIALTVGRDPIDPGQVAAGAAQATAFSYAFKVVANDAPSASYTNSEMYFLAKVQSARDNFGGADNVSRTTLNLGIVTAITEDTAHSI